MIYPQFDLIFLEKERFKNNYLFLFKGYTRIGPVVLFCFWIMSMKTPALKSIIPDFGTNKFSHGWGTSNSPCAWSSLSPFLTLLRKYMNDSSFVKMQPWRKLNPFINTRSSYNKIIKKKLRPYIVVNFFLALRHEFEWLS